MCSLNGFPGLPRYGNVNVCEVEGKIQSLSFQEAQQSQCETFTNAIIRHPKVRIPAEMTTSSYKVDTSISGIFMASRDSLFKQLFTTWYVDGFYAALVSANRDYCNEIPPFFRHCSKICLVAVDSFTRLKKNLNLITQEIDLGSVAQNADWNMFVRCLDWHPHLTKLAVGIANDSVRVYSADWPIDPILKCYSQVDIYCVAWRPYSPSDLAVGCRNGIILWTVDPSSVVARPNASCAKRLSRPGHFPVNSVSWSSDGDLLASASANDTTIYVWNPAQEQNAPLFQLGGGGTCFITWSPTGNRIFSATAGPVFRVWCSKKWTAERWSTSSSRVQSACWSPCGSVLLFCKKTEPYIYALRFDEQSVFRNDESRAVTVIDLTPVELSEIGDRVGGAVATIAWDSRGRHLAVVFRKSNVIAVFRTLFAVAINITPCCFINGLPEEIPATIAFQKNFDEGSILTIAWSSGRLQHFPIICSDLNESSLKTFSNSRNLSTTRLNQSQNKYF